MNQSKQTSEKDIKSFKNLTTIRVETALDNEKKLNSLQKILDNERGKTQTMAWDNVKLKKMIQTKTKQQEIQTKNAKLIKKWNKQQTQTKFVEKTQKIKKKTIKS